MKTVGAFVLVLTAVFGALVIAAAVVSRYNRGSFKWRLSLTQTASFVAWSMLMCQPFVQVMRRSLYVPTLARQVYAALCIAQLDLSAIVHASCYSAAVLAQPALNLVGCLVAVVITAVLFMIPARSTSGSEVQKLSADDTTATRASSRAVALSTLRRCALSCMLLLYPLACDNALSMLHCVRVGSGGLVLSSDASIQCFTGSHTGVAGLAVIVLIAHVAMFPLLTLVYLMKRISQAPVLGTLWQRTWGGFAGQDYRPDCFAFTHAWMVMSLVLAVMLVFVPISPSTPQGRDVAVIVITIAMPVAFAVAVLWLRPFANGGVWKQTSCICALVLTVVAAVGNFITAAAARHNSGGSLRADIVPYVVLLLLALLAVLLVLPFARIVTSGQLLERRASGVKRASAVTLPGYSHRFTGNSDHKPAPDETQVLNPMVSAAAAAPHVQAFAGGAAGRKGDDGGVMVRTNPLLGLQAYNKAKTRSAGGSGGTAFATVKPRVFTSRSQAQPHVPTDVHGHSTLV